MLWLERIEEKADDREALIEVHIEHLGRWMHSHLRT